MTLARWLLASCLAVVVLTCAVVRPVAAESLLVEAESFRDHGGWSLDTQFIDTMGSPYLLAHGLGTPVAPAQTTVQIATSAEYQVYVRTLDWVARWNAPGTPGRFQLAVNGQVLPETLGTTGAEWAWQLAGSVQVPAGTCELQLLDLSGFDGRCDAIYLTTTGTAPPDDGTILPGWRRQLLGLAESPTEKAGYDLVVVGGGYSGMGAAISAARAGCKVALLQNRGVLGGNGSSEVRVWAMGNIRRGKFPRIGEIVEEFSDRAKKSPGTFEEFEDARKEAIVRAEPNIDLFLHQHMFAVEMTSPQLVKSVTALNTVTSELTRFSGTLFCDATGHGSVGALAAADFDMEATGRMGMSNMWRWARADQPQSFPETPWALPLTMADFPYPRDEHGQWFWESGFDKDPIADAEAIRDWNLRAVFGAFQAMKNGDGASAHRDAKLEWVAYVGGPRESRLLLGDVILSQDDIVSKREFSDGCVPSTWSIDLHYPKQQYAIKFPDNPFISIAEHDKRVDREFGYPIPYRCFYSRNIENLFMAGRCISVTHEALGTVRVMKTCGMMGEVVGKAASVCKLRGCWPRDVYDRYWEDLEQLLLLPGKAHRLTVEDPFTIPSDSLPLATSRGPLAAADAITLAGIVVDDEAAELSGTWKTGTGLKRYVGSGYRFAAKGSQATAKFAASVPQPGRYELRVAYGEHPNRASNVPVKVVADGQESQHVIDMTAPPPLPNGLISLGEFTLQNSLDVTVTFTVDDSAQGFVHIDALQILPVAAKAPAAE